MGVTDINSISFIDGSLRVRFFKKRPRQQFAIDCNQLQ